MLQKSSAPVFAMLTSGLILSVMPMHASAFECSLGADGSHALIVRPAGDSQKLGIRKEKDCAGIRVVSGTVRIIYSDAAGIREARLAAGEVVNPEVLKPAPNSAFSAALLQLGSLLSGDVRSRPGVQRSRGDDDIEASFVRGQILMPLANIVIALPAGTDYQIESYTLRRGAQQIHITARSARSITIRAADLEPGARYAWSAKIGPQHLSGEFVVRESAERARIDREIETALQRSVPGAPLSPLGIALVRASIYAENGFHWDARAAVQAVASQQ